MKIEEWNEIALKSTDKEMVKAILSDWSKDKKLYMDLCDVYYVTKELRNFYDLNISTNRASVLCMQEHISIDSPVYKYIKELENEIRGVLGIARD